MPILQYRFGDGAARARALIDAGLDGPALHGVGVDLVAARRRLLRAVPRGAVRGQASAAAAS